MSSLSSVCNYLRSTRSCSFWCGVFLVKMLAKSEVRRHSSRWKCVTRVFGQAVAKNRLTSLVGLKSRAEIASLWLLW